MLNCNCLIGSIGRFPLSNAAKVDVPQIASLARKPATTPLQHIDCQCGQRFFLKSNYEVHLLFCKIRQEAFGVSPQVVNAPVTQNNNPISLPLETSVATSVQSSSLENPVTTPVPDPSPTVPEISQSEDIQTTAQTFEYVPLDESSGVSCETCRTRFPKGIQEGNDFSEDYEGLLVNCSKSFNDETQVETYTCDECGRDFLYKHPLERIQLRTRSVPPPKQHKCSICNRSFDTLHELSEHEEKHSSSRTRYSCATCGSKFQTRDELQTHYDDEANECTSLQCKLCYRRFVHNNHLKRHMTIHAGVKPFHCEICNHRFNQKSDLKRHIKRHSLDGKLSCNKCIVEFATINELREHVREHKKNVAVMGAFKCDMCNRAFGRKSHYKRHMSVHMGLKPHVCEVCGKSFNQRTDLKRHGLSHMRREMREVGPESGIPGIPELTCDICQRMFTSKTSLDEHVMSHQKIMNM